MFVAADEDGNMVSMIQSNNVGSGLAHEELGFLFQARGNAFRRDPVDALNSYQPRKRPYHTIIPALLLKDGKPEMVFG